MNKVDPFKGYEESLKPYLNREFLKIGNSNKIANIWKKSKKKLLNFKICLNFIIIFILFKLIYVNNISQVRLCLNKFQDGKKK